METKLEAILIKWLINSGACSTEVGTTQHGSVSAGFNLNDSKWQFYYTEITGYTISMLCTLYQKYGDKHYLNQAIASAEYLLRVQNNSKNHKKNDSFPKGIEQETGLIIEEYYTFDTAMCIQGLVHIYRLTQDKKYLESAIRAGEWLLSMQLTDGSFYSYYAAEKNELHHPGDYFYDDFGALHAKHSIALLKLYNETNDERFKKAATNVCDWVLSLQAEDGAFWVNHNKTYVYSHVQCYVLEGLIFAANQMDHHKYEQAIGRGIQWLKKQVLRNYGGIIGTHKRCASIRLPEDHSNHSLLKWFRRILPRKEIATDASFQAARLLLYRYEQYGTQDDLDYAVLIIKKLTPKIMEYKSRPTAISARVDVSLYVPRRSPIISTWAVLFALQAVILNNHDVDQDRKALSLEYLF